MEYSVVIITVLAQKNTMLRKNNRMTADGTMNTMEGDGIVVGDEIPKRSRIRDARLIRNCWLLLPILLLIAITFAFIPPSKRPFDLVSAFGCCVGTLLYYCN